MTEKCVYIICAHSDDQILGPGGTAAKYSKEGINVYTIIMSYGEFSHPWMQEKITTKARVKEAQNADKVIGGKGVMFLGLKEGLFKKEFHEKNLLHKLTKLLNDKKPIKIFTHSFNDPLPDHLATNSIVKELVRNLKFKPEIYSFPIWNPMSIKKRNRPKLIVDISSTVKLKINALLCFKSQKLSIYQLLPITLIKNFIAGLQYDMRFAEVFYRVELNDKDKK